MDRGKLVSALQAQIPISLAQDLVDAYLEIRRDVATTTLGRSAPGKFVETVVQVLQYLERGTHEPKPKVDSYLRTLESSGSTLDDGLRVCASRIARSMYTLRSKRNIVHKGDVDPNSYDLRFLLAGAQWVIAELIRVASSLPMEEAGRLVEAVTAPVGGMVEDFGHKRIVHGNFSIREELLVLLHSYHPETLPSSEMACAMDRRSASGVRNEIRRMWRAKLLEGDGKLGYRLTRAGVTAAAEILRKEFGS